MLEGLAAWVLNTYVGEYVENLNTDQLSIGLLQGAVELENLPLKKDALRKLDLPLQVKTGFIGRIKLQIPVSRLKSEPWVISMDRLYLVAGPLKTHSYDEEAEKKADQAHKLEQLKALEDKWKAENEIATQTSGYSWWGYGASLASLATNIMENIQLNVSNLHIRYEDDVSVPGHTFACGVTIKHLSAQSTDETWLPKFVSRYNADMMHKLLDLQNFSVYWDVDTELVGHLTMEKLGDAMSRECMKAKSSDKFKEHEYILEPVSGRANMKRNTSVIPLRSPSTPRLQFDVSLEKIAFSLSDVQYQGMLAILKEFSRYDKARKYRKWRPTTSVKDSPKNWWRYAIDSTMFYIHDGNRRKKPSYMFQRARDSVIYVKAYTQSLVKGTYYMDIKLKTEMDRIEEEWTFEELKGLRQVAMDNIREDQKLLELKKEILSQEAQAAASTADSQPDADQQGIFQRWFPGWSGWYGSAAPVELPAGTCVDAPPKQSATTPTKQDAAPPPKQDAAKPKTKEPPRPVSPVPSEADVQLEQGILDVIADSAENNTLLKRDTVFAQLNFCLQQGMFKLCSCPVAAKGEDPGGGQLKPKSLLELECSIIKMNFESRPRSNGLKFGVSVGGLFLRDKMTKDSIMPVLIAPQARERLASQPRQLFGSMVGGMAKQPVLQQTALFGQAPAPHDQTLFELLYEKKPPRSQADYRLEIKTQPLDIVYNATTMKTVTEFFRLGKGSSAGEKAEMELAAAAKRRYEQLKRQTTIELRQTIDELIEGDEKMKAKRWDFALDISAPQFIIPENFTDPNSTMVLFDLGRLKFHNLNAPPDSSDKETPDDEDEFVTPTSTPPSEKEEDASSQSKEIGSPPDVFSENLSEAALHDKIYDKYTLLLSELQVMVGRARDNWKHAHNKGTSLLHVLDKFSISLQLERRLLYTADPQWPKATISGTLPSLVLHFSEQKVQALNMVSQQFSQPETPPSSPPATAQKPEMTPSQASTNIRTSISEDDHRMRLMAESRLLLMQFSITQVSLEIQSRGRSIAELQVRGVRAHFTKQHYNTSISFTVHSLLVVDALQTFGPDFELLVASHRNLCLDSRSGSIRDSDPNSPRSPQSPQSPSSPTAELELPRSSGSFGTVQNAVTNALNSLLSSSTGSYPDEGPPSLGDRSQGMFAASPIMDMEALIRVELDLISPACPSNSSPDEELRIANVQFNNLDIVANQQTIVELLSFFKHISPSSKRHPDRKSSRASEVTIQQPPQGPSTRLEVTAEFHRLNVLLMRAEEVEQGMVGRKVATATLSKAKIEATVAGSVTMEGSLDGMQLLDLTPEGRRHHQKIFSLGIEPDMLMLDSDFLRQSAPGGGMGKERALQLTLMRPEVTEEVAGPLGRVYSSPQPKEPITISLRMASLCYTHSPNLLRDISLCVSEFKDYMSGAANTIKYAATEVAMGLVHKRSEFLSQSLYGSNLSLDGARKRMSSLGPGEAEDSILDATLEAESEAPLNMCLDVVLQTPVVVIPRKPGSKEVLVAHLGHISLQNSQAHSATNAPPHHFQPIQPDCPSDLLYVEIRDMSLYTFNLKQQKARADPVEGSMYKSCFATLHKGNALPDIYGSPILHDTIIQLTVENCALDENYVNPDVSMEIPFGADMNKTTSVMDSVLKVHGKIASPFRLELSKGAYEQILQTLDHLTPKDEDPKYPRSSHSQLTEIREEAETPTSPDDMSHTVAHERLRDLTDLSERPVQNIQSAGTAIQAQFEMPSFNVRMLGDFADDRGIVELRLADFKANFSKYDPYVTQLEVSLQSFILEDLHSPDLHHRYLMLSNAAATGDMASGPEIPPYLSASCPTSMIAVPQPHMPPSLPTSFHKENVFETRSRSASGTKISSQKRRTKSAVDCPSTPPPSPQSSPMRSRQGSVDSVKEDKFIHLKVKLVDRKCPEFATKYKQTNRFVDVAFSGLDTMINLQTWVLVLDFLGLGAKVHDLNQFTKDASEARLARQDSQSQPAGGEEVHQNTELKFHVQRLTLTLNKPEYELAHAHLNSVSANVHMREGNLALHGQLGSLSLLDTSPHGRMFRERFITTGSQALDFDIFKYGTPDPDLQRDHDVRVKLQMSSVRYVHTQRFLQELLAFIQHFNQLQDVLGRSRAASAGQKISDTAFRGARVSMDIQAGAPILVFPHSSRSTDTLVMNLGTLTVSNTFLHAGKEGTIGFTRDRSSSCDVTTPDVTSKLHGNSSAPVFDKLTASQASGLPEVDVCMDSMSQSVYGSLDEDWRQEDTPAVPPPSSAGKPLKGSASDSKLGSQSGRRPSASSSMPGSVDTSSSAGVFDPANHCCLLDVLQIALLDMDIYSGDWMSKDDYNDAGLQQDLVFPSYVIVRHDGRLLKERCRLNLQVERNLEGDRSHAVPDLRVQGALSSVHCWLECDQYRLIRGFLEHNLGEPLEEFQRPLLTHLQEPTIQTVLSGNVWKSISICVDLHNFTLELLNSRDAQGLPETSLAKFDFNKSRLTFESFSDQSKDIDLVSHEIVALDTRYQDAPANTKPNMFPSILRASQDCARPDALQMELHFRSSREATRLTALLNNMRLMGIFDWCLEVKEYLMTSAENPFVQDVFEKEKSPVHDASFSTYNVTSGVFTKRAPVTEEVKPPLEVKLNVTDTELVVVENAAAWDTNAVILKSTAVLSYRPSMKERVMSCSLQSLEVFSCSLAAEDETALSIIDPMTITMELVHAPVPQKRVVEPAGLMDAYTDEDRAAILEISFSVLNVRLSYNDLKLFLAIFNSLPQQAQQVHLPKNHSQASLASSSAEVTPVASGAASPVVSPTQSVASVKSQTSLPAEAPPSPSKEASGIIVTACEMKAGSVCLCLIDDCLDADIPLGELTFSNLHLFHKWTEKHEGWAVFKLAGDYYNCSLSGWEPFLESWGCHLRWEMGKAEENKMTFNLSANDVLNFNVTRAFLDQLKKTKQKWTDDYYNASQPHDNQFMNTRRRVPFVPFSLKNETGCKLWFRTDTASPTRVTMSGSSTGGESRSLTSSLTTDKDWQLVPSGEERQFLFEEREKIRHKHTHELKVHQVCVKIADLRGEEQVSVDKVGLFFREAQHAAVDVAMLNSKEPPARIVFDVTLQGSARKLLTVRSSLVVHNKLEDPVMLRLEHHKDQRLEKTLWLDRQSQVAIPLTHVLARIWAKPEGYSVDYCSKPIYWQHVMKKGESRNSLRTCEPPFGGYAPYKFCVSVYRQHFPEETITASTTEASNFPRPGHVITLIPPVRVVNLLPVEMTYFFKNTSLRSTIKPGKTAAVIGADLQKDLELGVTLDNFPECNEVVIPPGTTDYDTLLVLQDYSRRPLHLYVQVKEGIGGSLKLLISAPFWLVNKCGVPLVFRQDNSKHEMAGQLEDHEVGQSFMPLLFSYSDLDLARQISLRIGRDPRLHGPRATPVWCPSFSLERGIAFLQLHVRPPDNRPDWVYNLGIEVRQGRGRYDKTHIVTLSPRYHLDNRSSRKLAFSQKYCARIEDIGSDKFFSVPSGGKMPFHWARQDLDPLLCVCILEKPNSFWSGGFQIDRVDSFHVHIRCPDDQSQFLRVDITMQGATYFIVFSDADHMPPPYRLDNHSQVPIIYYQTKVTDEQLRETVIKPQNSVPYAFDEPTLPPHITLCVQSGTKSTYNMDVIGEGAQLTYENFIYITFTATFKGSTCSRGAERAVKGYNSFVETQELVLDVIHGNKVILKKKESGKRSQFWCMTSTGMLQHEGSSSPREPGSSKPGKASQRDVYVLDIADLALRPGHDTPLTLRKPDGRRRSTQTWRFSPDGRLCLGSGNTMASLCVQAKNGFFGLQDGGEAVLGPSPVMRTPEDVPPEMAVQREKMRPGSGLLSVEVVTDGPTRVLLIRDIQAKQSLPSPGTPPEDWVMINRSVTTLSQESQSKRPSKEISWQVVMKGIGVSLVNHVPEELLYISLQHIDVNSVSDAKGMTFSGSVGNVQVNNQLFGTHVPVLLYMSPTRKESPMTPELPSGPGSNPALSISLRKMASSAAWNADIYENLIVNIRKFVMIIEERLLWKLFEFAGYNQKNMELEQLDENSFKSQRALPEAMAEAFKLKRYYFGRLELNTSRLTLSMITSSDLPKNLKDIKKSLGIPLVRFEDANVEMDPFIKVHPFETSAFLVESVSQHYTEELKSQAAKILGSVDFLGNPLGLFNDVTEGLSGLLKDGNLGGLIQNVTHGVSNSAAKVTGSLSDGLSALTVDKGHEKTRQDIRSHHTQSSRGHILAGMKGLGHGLFGGLTGIVTQPYSRMRQDGIEGLVPGLTSGVLGIVTKPVAGVLDFASSTASAVRDKSRRSSHIAPPRTRPPRCCHGPGGLLPHYSESHASAQQFLYTLNHNNYQEMFISTEHLRFGQNDGMKVLLSSHRVYFLGRTTPDHDNIVLQATYNELVFATTIHDDLKYYIELCMQEGSESGVMATERLKRPKVRCDSETICRKVVQQIMYAKNLHDESRQTLPPEGLVLED